MRRFGPSASSRSNLLGGIIITYAVFERFLTRNRQLTERGKPEMRPWIHGIHVVAWLSAEADAGSGCNQYTKNPSQPDFFG
jgi:hypothetical protein